MDADIVASFCSITNSAPKHAERYLAFSGGDLDTAVMLFFENGGQMPDDEPAATTLPESSLPHLRAPEPEDDEALARRLAQEWESQAEEVRAPIAPTRQVLQDDTDAFDDYGIPPTFVNRFGALAGSSAGNSSRNGGQQPRGVFNQAPPSTWDEQNVDAMLNETTGGASAQSAKSSRLVSRSNL